MVYLRGKQSSERSEVWGGGCGDRPGERCTASSPMLQCGVAFALLGIDPGRPLVDSLIEN